MSKIIKNALLAGLGGFWLLFWAGFSGGVSAAVLLDDNFQGDLSKWHPGSGLIVADPKVNGEFALTFDTPTVGGDMFSKNTFTSSDGWFGLSYDYLGLNLGGGFVGVHNPGERWLSGVNFPGLVATNPNTNQWEHVSFSFYSAEPIQLELEAWLDWNATPREAYFKNFVLTGNPVPEPSTLALLSIGWAGLAARRRKARID